MKIIYEDDDICITDLEKNFDFIALIENKTNKDLYVDFIDEFGDFTGDTITIEKNNYIGILADEQGYKQLDKLYQLQYYINIKKMQ